MAGSAAIIVIAADYSRTTGKYGERGIPYVHMEVGAAAQNIQLQAAARGLGAVFVGAFDDDQVCYVLGPPTRLGRGDTYPRFRENQEDGEKIRTAPSWCS